MLKVAPRIKINLNKQAVDLDTAKAVLGNRLQVLSNFARQVTTPVIKTELCSSSDDCREKSRQARNLLNSTQQLDTRARAALQQILEESQVLDTVYQYQQRLHDLWERNSETQEARMKEVQDWVSNAEKTGIEALEQFAQRLRGYSLA